MIIILLRYPLLLPNLHSQHNLPSNLHLRAPSLPNQVQPGEHEHHNEDDEGANKTVEDGLASDVDVDYLVVVLLDQLVAHVFYH